MSSSYNIIQQVTSGSVSGTSGLIMLNDFAYGMGWQPSDPFYAPQVEELATAHILVEHGLENTAVLTFLRSPHSYSDLGASDRTNLLGLSYNNLVDWHIHIGAREAAVVYNRISPHDSKSVVANYKLLNGGVNNLRSESFEQLVGKSPTPNLPPLDDALIDTISKWKRTLSAELSNKVSNEALSALFNGIIFARAIEDHASRERSHRNESRALLNVWNSTRNQGLSLASVISQTIKTFLNKKPPTYLFDQAQLQIFDQLGSETIVAVLTDFYRNNAVPYKYDFSVMSKHALSRIYEHYVSILRTADVGERAQLFMFPRLPEEEKSKAYGSVYTPQFIARFFAKFIEEQMGPTAFRRMTATDPSCGSGIFIRTLLELKFEPVRPGVTSRDVHTGFQNVCGIDVDVNAVQATKLSLALLSLALTGSLPPQLNVFAAEAIEYFQRHPNLKNSQDAIVVNPPFVPVETQPPAIRERIATLMASHATGRIDTYLAFLRLGLEMLKPGGFGLFVLPHSFLLAKSAAQMRTELAEQTWIRCLADLSAIRVFGETGSYVVLLIFQKKPIASDDPPPATIVKCQDMVGRALQDALYNREIETPTYSVYKVAQDYFHGNDWIILPPTEATLKRSFEKLTRLEEFLQIREGFISGADDIFIRSHNDIPEGEEEIYVPYLSDREMKSYKVPTRTSRLFLYPFLNSRPITEYELKKRFPETWNYLLKNKAALSKRSPVRKGDLVWWKPVRPRSPQNMMRPKIISPHLVLVPRFSLDVKGKYAISRSPLMYPKREGAERDLLLYFLAILNSTACYWHISNHSHVYQNGYAMLEVKTLNTTPVPDPGKVPTTTLKRLMGLVSNRLQISGPETSIVEAEIDELVSELYGLNTMQRRALGM